MITANRKAATEIRRVTGSFARIFGKLSMKKSTSKSFKVHLFYS